MQEKVFAGAVLVVTVLLCIGMPKISDKLKPESPFTQEFAAGIVEEVLEDTFLPIRLCKENSAVRRNYVLKSSKEPIKIQNLKCIIRSAVYTAILRIRA